MLNLQQRRKIIIGIIKDSNSFKIIKIKQKEILDKVTKIFLSDLNPIELDFIKSNPEYVNKSSSFCLKSDNYSNIINPVIKKLEEKGEKSLQFSKCDCRFSESYYFQDLINDLGPRNEEPLAEISEILYYFYDLRYEVDSIVPKLNLIDIYKKGLEVDEEKTLKTFSDLLKTVEDYLEVIRSYQSKLRELTEFLKSPFLNVTTLKKELPNYYEYLKKD